MSFGRPALRNRVSGAPWIRTGADFTPAIHGFRALAANSTPEDYAFRTKIRLRAIPTRHIQPSLLALLV